MKRILALLLTLVLIAGLVACANEPETAEPDVPEVTETPTPIELETEEPDVPGVTETPAPTEPETEDPDVPEVTETPAPTEPDEEDIEEPVVIESPSGLNDDIFSFAFSLNGEVFALPFEYSAIYAHGWVFEASDVELGPNQRTFTTNIRNGSETIGVSIGNLTPNVIPYYEGLIGGITMHDRHANTGTQFILAGGITIGSTLEAVLEAYGEPSVRRETTLFITLEYRLRIQSEIRIQVNQDSGLVTEIQMTNFIERQQVEFEGELPEIAQGYTAPTALGNDWTIGIVELEGQLYQLPAPVSVFLNNGWELVSENAMVPAGRVAVMQNIRLGNQVMRVSIANFDRVEQPLVNGFVTRVEFNRHFWVGDIALPGGLNQNSTLADFMAVFGEYNRREESASFTWYEFGANLRELITVGFNNSDGSVHSIELRHELRELPW